MTVLVFVLPLLLVLVVAWIVTRPGPQLINNQSPILPRDYPVACVECGRVHDGECLNYAIWRDEP